MNVTLGIIALITMLFCIGTLDQALDSEIPYLQLFLNTGSIPLAYVLTVLLFILIFLGNITALATTSREVFAFARDKGFPFSTWMSRIDKRRHLPFNAVYITSFFSGVLCCINFGSTIAFNIVVSLSLLALLSTYMLSIGCVLLRRINHQPLPPARWSLGSYGVFINAFAFVYSAFAIVFSCFPVGLPVGLADANWAPAVWVGVMIVGLVSYVVHGKRHFTAPVVFVEGMRTGGLQESG
jgi:choline transport protein